MKPSLIFIVLSILSLLGCDYVPKDDKHPEVSFFEDIIKDKTIFEPIATIDKNPSISHQIFFLNNGRYFSFKEYLEEINQNNQEDNKKDIDHQSVYDLEIRDLKKNIYFQDKIIEPNNSYSPLVIDKNANLYFKEHLYLSPNYNQKQEAKLINITDSLQASISNFKNETNIDSTKNIHLLLLEKKYNFKKKENVSYIIQNGNVILFQNQKIINDSEQKWENFDEFDDSILVEYRNDNRAFPSSYYYSYYSFGNIKFKYSDGRSGTIHPRKIEYGGQVYLFHPKFGIYRFKKI